MLSFILFAWCGVVFVSANASCRDSVVGNYSIVTCSGFSNSSELRDQLLLLPPQKEFTLVLKDGWLDRLDSETMDQLQPSVLELSNVTVDSFCDEGAFAGLRESLTSIAFYHESSLPCSWSVLRRLDRLQALSLSGLSQLNLTSSFNQLPQSLKILSIAHASISNVDEDWISSLAAIQIVSIRNTNLNTFLRSMLPKPAPFLRRLDLFNNSIASLENNFSEGLPVLKYLTLDHNKIKTFEEATLAPLLHSASHRRVRLIGNPLHCDCRLRFLLSYPREWLRASCKTPRRLIHRSLNTLTEADLSPCAQEP
ncbi:unnamed protein product [Ixodes hexagonus]